MKLKHDASSCLSRRTYADHVPDRVQVERGRATLAKSLLHGILLRGIGTGVVEPIGVDRAGRGSERECKTAAGVIRVQSRDLAGDLGVTARTFRSINGQRKWR